MLYRTQPKNFFLLDVAALVSGYFNELYVRLIPNYSSDLRRSLFGGFSTTAASYFIYLLQMTLPQKIHKMCKKKYFIIVYRGSLITRMSMSKKNSLRIEIPLIG